MDDTKPNYSELARRYDCDTRTVKRYYSNEQKAERKKTIITTKIPLSKLWEIFSDPTIAAAILDN